MCAIFLIQNAALVQKLRSFSEPFFLGTVRTISISWNSLFIKNASLPVYVCHISLCILGFCFNSFGKEERVLSVDRTYQSKTEINPNWPNLKVFSPFRSLCSYSSLRCVKNTQTFLAFCFVCFLPRRYGRQCCGSTPHWFQCRSGSSIFGQCGSDPVFWSPKIEEKNFQDTLFHVFYKKNCNSLIPRPP